MILQNFWRSLNCVDWSLISKISLDFWSVDCFSKTSSIWLRESYSLVIPLDMFLRISNMWLTISNKLKLSLKYIYIYIYNKLSKIYGSMVWYGLDMMIDKVNGQIWLLLFGLHVETCVSGFIFGKWPWSSIMLGLTGWEITGPIKKKVGFIF